MHGMSKSAPIRYDSQYALTDCGNAERLVDQHGDCLRFCSAMRHWFLWKGNLRRRADALEKWATRSEGASRIIAMLRMAESDPRVLVEPGDFDTPAWALNLHNGTIDLKHGHFREHRPEELLTRLAGAEYQSNIQCPRWKQFLAEVFAPHPEIVPFLQRAVGYTLTGETREECVFVLAGSGRNGKSTLIGILHRILGQYGGVAEMDTFLASQEAIDCGRGACTSTRRNFNLRTNCGWL